MSEQRPAIVQIAGSEIDDQVVMTVTLAWQDEEYRGEAVGPSHPEALPRLVGEATLRAVEQVAHGNIHLDLAAIATAPLGEVQVAMAQVVMEGDEGRFIGSAILDEHDSAAATVRAVLDAINRRLELIL